MSQRTAVTAAGAGASRTVSSSAAPRRPHVSTEKRPHKWCTRARPMPLPPPVTTTQSIVAAIYFIQRSVWIWEA